MGKTQAEIELEETMRKLEKLFPRETAEQISREIGYRREPPVKPKRPIPSKPEIQDWDNTDYEEPISWKPKRLPNPNPSDFNFKEPKEPKEPKKPSNPWIYVSVFAVIALVALGGYFTYTMSKQAPPTTNLNTSLSCPPVSCGANSCGACTCTPVVNEGNITCAPSTILHINNGTNTS